MAGMVDRSDAYCVVGAGAAGLTAAKNLLQFGFDVDVVEREGEVGGTWNTDSPYSGAYRSIHMITSKPYIQYQDFPIPDDYPTFLGHRHCRAYLRSYAEHFDVYPRIEFRRTVTWIERADGSPYWTVTLDGDEQRRYAGVVIANGHNWKGRIPEYPGEFTGDSLHSVEYRTPDLFRGKRVLVVGGGTSGCDIAVEASQNASAAFLSVRRGCYIWPKYMFGLPTDAVYEFVLKFRFPLPILRYFGGWFLRLNTAGRQERYGLPKPAHKLLQEHLVLNSTLLYQLGHGELQAKPDVAELAGDRVRFTDGSEEKIDVIVYATGYRQTEFPFIDHAHLNWTGRQPELHLNAFHPVYDNLFVIGYFQTSTGWWPLMDLQSQLMSRYLYLLREDPQRAAWFRRAKSELVPGERLSGGYGYYDSQRHWVQVENYTYRAALKKLIRRMKVDPPAGTVATPAAEQLAPARV